MAKKKEIVVVGAGMFGCIAAALARAEGHAVTVVGEHRHYEASPASGCVMAPSWLTSLDKDDVADAMAVLNDLYKVHDVEFKTHLGAKFKAKRIDVRSILRKPDVEGRVAKVDRGVAVVTRRSGQTVATVKSDAALIATGIWTKELVPNMPDIKGLYGASMLIAAPDSEPRLQVYAPYRQAVTFPRDAKTAWVGDGTALSEGTWVSEESRRLAKLLERGENLLGLKGKEAIYRVFVGARPMVVGHKGGFFQQVDAKTWVSTGGAKNGTVLAALQALKFVRSL